MAVLTESGRTAMAAAIAARALHLAWGTGNALWETAVQGEYAFEESIITLPHKPVKQVVVKDAAGEVTFTANSDYTVDSVNGTLTHMPSGIIPEDANVKVSYIINTPPESLEATTLLNEVGRRTADEVRFCLPDPQGELLTPTGRFTASLTPTNNLYLRFTFDFENASNKTIRELGVMVGSIFKEDLPPGQRYFELSDIINPGTLLVLENTVPIIRTPATRETFTFVVTF